MSTPEGLRPGGRALWSAITDDHELDAVQLAQLEEACRAKDRLDQLDRVLRGDVDCWTEIVTDSDGTPVSLRIDSALGKANETANLMKQLLAALRLPDAQTGKRPQYRGPRGAQKPTIPGGAKVSSLDRARQRTQTG
jgi:hypothetical protein